MVQFIFILLTYHPTIMVEINNQPYVVQIGPDDCEE